MTHRHTHVRATAALVTTALAAAALVSGVARPAAGAPAVAPAALVAATTDGPPVAPVDWTPCEERFECATVQVPLDHDRPEGPTIDIALLRAPATSPETRIGSLFVNPGGPGGSGVEFVTYFASSLPDGIRERFDVVGFDPRGTMRSTPLRCYRTPDEALADLPPVPYPQTAAEEDLVIAANRRLVDACRRHAGQILAHMSTADVARDLDLLREAVGDEGLTYLGYSYGSVLGQTYANLFPDRVRSLVIDGVVDPRAWAGEGVERWTVPVETRLRSAESAQQTLGEFFRLCDQAGVACPLGPDSASRFDQLAERLRRGPIEVTDRFGTWVVTYHDVIMLTFGTIFYTSLWPGTAALLALVESGTDAAGVRAGLASLRTGLGLDAPQPGQDDYLNTVEARVGVLCADSENPHAYHWYREAADVAEERFGYFGRVWNWEASECAVWPAEARLDRYEGPWDAWTANPVLIVGNRYDPSTGYHGAVAASQLLPNSRLITYAGWGHLAYLSAGSPCVDSAVTAYLLTSVPPAEDLRCEPTRSPFDLVDEPGAAAAPDPSRRALLPLALRQALG